MIVEDGKFELAGVLCSVYQQDIVQNMMESPLMAVKYTWSRNIILALDHFCEHMKIVCNKKRRLHMCVCVRVYMYICMYT